MLPPDPSPEQIVQQDQLAARISRLRQAMAALEQVIARVPSDNGVPVPMRLALRDFASELSRLEEQVVPRSASLPDRAPP